MFSLLVQILSVESFWCMKFNYCYYLIVLISMWRLLWCITYITQSNLSLIVENVKIISKTHDSKEQKRIWYFCLLWTDFIANSSNPDCIDFFVTTIDQTNIYRSLNSYLWGCWEIGQHYLYCQAAYFIIPTTIKY